MSLIHNWNESSIYRTCFSEGGWQVSRRAWELLHQPLEEDATRSFPLEREGNAPSFVEGVMEPRIWESLPLADHQLLSPLAEDVTAFREAFAHLDRAHPTLAEKTRHFLQAVALVKLREGASSESTCVTSVSIPDLPFCSFFSRKALIHIPPHIVSPQPDIRFLAENLYHESVHHRVTTNLLENNLFQPEYHTQHSPRVAIPWRHGDSERMRFWQLDRVLHAFCVYVALLPYRLAEAEQNPETGWEHLFAQARACVQFLGEALFRQQKMLTPMGYAYVSSQWSLCASYPSAQSLAR